MYRSSFLPASVVLPELQLGMPARRNLWEPKKGARPRFTQLTWVFHHPENSRLFHLDLDSPEKSFFAPKCGRSDPDGYGNRNKTDRTN